MGRLSSRRLLVALVLVVLVVLVTPSSAFAALAVTHDLNWGSNGTGDGQFTNPADVAASKFGDVYVAGGATDNRIQRFFDHGGYQDSWDTTGSGAGGIDQPVAVALDRWDSVYVADAGNGRVGIFNPQFYSHVRDVEDWLPTYNNIAPYGLGVGLNQHFYASNSFSSVLAWNWWGDPWDSKDATGAVRGVTVSQDGEIYTTNDNYWADGDKVVVYDRRNLEPVRSWGSAGSGNGQLNRPFDVAVDPVGHVFVTDTQNNRVQVFDSGGTFLTQFGSLGSGDASLSLPAGIAVGPSRHVYVTDSGHDRISKWTVDVATEVTQVAGPTRIQTAIEASKRAYPDGSFYAVIATARSWPDALSGAALAGVWDAPLLLTEPDVASPEVIAEIQRLGALKVYVLGGTGAISQSVQNQLQAATGLNLSERLGGATRYETSALIASETVEWLGYGDGYDGTAFVATGRNFPDALAASPIAAANGWPIFLTPPGGLPTATSAKMSQLGVTRGYVLGGTNAVWDDVIADLDDMSPLPPGAFDRVGGASRYKTAMLLGERGYEEMGMLISRPAIATGASWPDALAGGVLQGSDANIMLLAAPTGLDPDVAIALASWKDSIYEMRFLGGKAAVPQVVRDQVTALLH